MDRPIFEPEHQALREAWGATSIARSRRSTTSGSASGGSRARCCAAIGALGFLSPAVPGALRRRGQRRLPLQRRADRGAGAARVHGRGDGAFGAPRRRAAVPARAGDRGAAGALAARPGVRRAVRGDRDVRAGTGSDVAAIATRARRVDGGYVVSGAKTFISNGLNADLVVTAVRTERGRGHRGLSILVIEEGMDGLHARAQPGEARHPRRGHGRAVLRRRVRARREPARRGGPGLPLPDAQPRPGAARDRDDRGRGRAGRDRSHAGVRQGAARVRPPGRHVPELALQARRLPRRDAGHPGPRRRRARAPRRRRR